MASYLSNSELKEELMNYLLTCYPQQNIDEYISYANLTTSSAIKLRELYEELAKKLSLQL